MSTKQDKIKEGVEQIICGHCFDYSEYPSLGKTDSIQEKRDRCRGEDACAFCTDLREAIFKYEHSQDVVIKGECLGVSHPHLASYFTVEPLIAEVE